MSHTGGENFRKVGIITITRGENYGNKLQNYAVQEVLTKLGFSPETIINTTSKTQQGCKREKSIIRKLRPIHICKVINARTKKKYLVDIKNDGFVKTMLWVLRNKRVIVESNILKKKAFEAFVKAHINTSNAIVSSGSIDYDSLDEYRYFVCGSDQIWNPYYPQTSSIDFLQFAPKEKRVAFAPSFGVDHIPEYKRDLYKKWINAIQYLSVREEQGAKIIKELTGRRAVVLLDPTLILDKDRWLRIQKKPRIDTDQKYLLTYFLGRKSAEYKKVISKIANSNGYRIINLADIHEFENYAIDPGEFVYLINQADMVCTDSFHGIVFSIIMNTNFFVFNRDEDGHSMSSRLVGLLNKFGLKDRMVSCSETAERWENIDFTSTDKIIEAEKTKAFAFLSDALWR